jgi:hypothetical protein
MIHGVEERLKKISEQITENGIISLKPYEMKNPSFLVDGLLFVPKNSWYIFENSDETYKWKPREKMTVDLSIYSPYVVGQFWRIEKEKGRSYPGIWECQPTGRPGAMAWRPVRQRTDKETPNTIEVILATQDILSGGRGRFPESFAELARECLAHLRPSPPHPPHSDLTHRQLPSSLPQAPHSNSPPSSLQSSSKPTLEESKIKPEKLEEEGTKMHCVRWIHRSY